MDNNEVQNADLRKDSAKFIKVYMFCLVMAVMALISISYFSQNKLNNEIERLTTLVDTTEDEIEINMSKVESLQKLTEEQEKIISKQNAEIEGYQDIEMQLEATDKLWQICQKYYSGAYAEAKEMVTELETNSLENSLSAEGKVELSAVKNGILEAEILAKMGLLDTPETANLDSDDEVEEMEEAEGTTEPVE